MEVIYDFLNGKQCVYTSDTIFHVQLGRNKKASYQTLRSFKGNLTAAVLWYNALNIRYPFKKRLYSEYMTRPVMAREWAQWSRND